MLVKQFKKNFPEGIPFSWFMERHGEVFREIDGRKTIRFEEQGESYFIKMHTGVGWKEIFKNLFRFKKPVLGAKNEYLAIKQLTNLNISTMTLVGYATKGWNPAKLQSFIITEELKETISLEDYCASWFQYPPVYQDKQLLIRKVAMIAKKIHENGINHRDFYLCHFLMNKKGVIHDKTCLFLIDLHRVQIRNKVPRRWLIKDLSALYFSAMYIGLTQRDYYRFIKIYQGKTLRKCFQQETKFWNKIEKKSRIIEKINERIKDKKIRIKK